MRLRNELKGPTFENWCNFKHTEAANCQHLTEGKLHKEHWNTSENEGKTEFERKLGEDFRNVEKLLTNME